MIKNGAKRIRKNMIEGKAIQAAKFLSSVYLLIMLDSLLLNPHYTSLHFTQPHFTTLVDTSLPVV